VDFTIRNLPATVLDDLERAARLNGRSVNDEVIARLTPASRRSPGDVTAERAETDHLRSSSSVPPLTAEYPEPEILPVQGWSRGQAGRRRPVAQFLADLDAMQKRDPVPELTPELLDELKREGRA
jgi:plasmid stability protein